MKGNIAFLLILAVIAAAGFYSTDIANRFIDRNAGEIVTLERSNADKTAIYLSDNETGFDPFSSLGRDLDRSGSSEFMNKRSVCTALVTVLSQYSENAVPANIYSPDYYREWQSDFNGNFFLKHAAYKNAEGKERFVDCIIDTSCYMVTYLRYYTDEIPELSPEKINSGLEKLDSYTDYFFNRQNEWTISLELASYEEEGEEMSESYRYIREYGTEHELLLPEKTETLVDSLNSLYNASADLFMGHVPDDPLFRFWIPPLSMPLTYIEGTGVIYGINHVIDNVCSGVPTNGRIKSSYSTYEGRIYQSANINGQQLVMIYNISSDELEGFYAPTV